VTNDPSTILIATTSVCGLSALAFWCGVRALGFSRAAGRDWASANLLFGLGSALTVLRASWPHSLLYGAADTFELLGLACLHAGFLRFMGRSWPLREHVGLVGAGVLGIFAAYALGMPVLRLAIYCGVAAWLLGRTAWVAYRGLPTEFGAAAAAVVTAPIALASSLEALRGLSGLFIGADAANALEPTLFNALLLWAAFAIALMLNFAIAGFAGARQVAQIRALTLKDTLTGTLNRGALERLLHRELRARRRHGMALSLVYIDLDHFKALNDRFGHAAGDAALCHAASVLVGSCRDGDSVARVGGEEFCVLLPFTELDGACLMAQRMRGTLEATPLVLDQQTLVLTASFGVACSDSVDETGADLLQRADKAMYEAKQSGRNNVCAALPTMTASPVGASDDRRAHLDR